MALPRGAKGWSAVCDCGIYRLYSLAFLCLNTSRICGKNLVSRIILAPTPVASATFCSKVVVVLLLNYCLSVTLILTELFQHNLINVSYLMACYLYQVMMTLHFLYDVANDAESTQKSKNTS